MAESADTTDFRVDQANQRITKLPDL